MKIKLGLLKDVIKEEVARKTTTVMLAKMVAQAIWDKLEASGDLKTNVAKLDVDDAIDDVFLELMESDDESVLQAMHRVRYGDKKKFAARVSKYLQRYVPAGLGLGLSSLQSIARSNVAAFLDEISDIPSDDRYAIADAYSNFEENAIDTAVEAGWEHRDAVHVADLYANILKDEYGIDMGTI